MGVSGEHDYTVIGRADGGRQRRTPGMRRFEPYGALQNGVSRRHAATSHDKGAIWRIEDLESTNGTRASTASSFRA